MPFIMDCASQYAASCIAKCEIVIRFSPSEGLRTGQNRLLRLFLVIPGLPVGAPSGLVLALGAVLAPVNLVVIHLIDVIKAACAVLLHFLGLLSG